MNLDRYNIETKIFYNTWNKWWQFEIKESRIVDHKKLPDSVICFSGYDTFEECLKESNKIALKIHKENNVEELYSNIQ